MASPMAVNSVFATPELVEGILIHLPLKDLLFAQAVCTYWKAVIDGSQLLQKALFFRPATSDVAFWHAYHGKGMEQCNIESKDFYYRVPTDATHFVRDFEECVEEQYKAWPRLSQSRIDVIERLMEQIREKMVKTRVFLNPLLVAKSKWFDSVFRGRYARYGAMTQGFDDTQVKDDEALLVAYERPEASWRQMLITQPPLGSVSAWVDEDTKYPSHDAWNRFAVEDAGKPVKMEALRTAMVGHHLVINGTNYFEVWENGETLWDIVDRET